VYLFLELTYWSLLFLIWYTFVGYAFALLLLVGLKRVVTSKKEAQPLTELPAVTLLIAAYNEEDFIKNKLDNALALDYPKDKLNLLVVTDGCSDRTPEIVASYKGIQHFHSDERKGKLAAVDRVMPHVTTPITVFSDANTLLNKAAILNIVKHYANEKVGVVSGEKRILSKTKDQAAGAGEGFYWKYESKLKKWDFDLYSTVGAAGELFSIRTDLHQQIPGDSIIEDFCLSMKIVQQGYIIAYEPDAYAIETASASAGEELKRKIRIAAGGMQSIIRFSSLLNPFRYGILSFQYFSHRVLRWSVAPFSLILVVIINALLWNQGPVYRTLMIAQVFFYGCAAVGYFLQGRSIKLKVFFIPYYFCMMNYAVIAGIFRYFRGEQSAVWEKAKRAESSELVDVASEKSS
jgi:cellulose synthase/poly-beta-1,6-N-acetylglucosamine synthase-like glycosyltransferase